MPESDEWNLSNRQSGRIGASRDSAQRSHHDCVHSPIRVGAEKSPTEAGPGTPRIAEYSSMDGVRMMINGRDDETLARDMMEVHGMEAATVARTNARAAALAGQVAQAKSWIRLLGIIQRQQAGKT